MAGVLTKAERVQIITTMTSKEFSPAITWYERALVCYELTVQAYEQRLTVYEAQESTNAMDAGRWRRKGCRMADQPTVPWPEGTVQGFVAYVQRRFGVTLPEETALRIMAGINENRFTVEEAVDWYVTFTLGAELLTQFLAGLHAGAEEVVELLAPSFDRVGEAFNRIIQIIHEYSILARRATLYDRLPAWWPERVRDWVSMHWPERWLPELAEDDPPGGPRIHLPII